MLIVPEGLRPLLDLLPPRPLLIRSPLEYSASYRAHSDGSCNRLDLLHWTPWAGDLSFWKETPTLSQLAGQMLHIAVHESPSVGAGGSLTLLLSVVAESKAYHLSLQEADV